MLTNRIGVGEWQRHAKSHPWIGNEQRSHNEHPICPNCEKIALRHKGWTKNRIARCPSCGWTGVATVLMKEYKQQQLWRS